ncbi:hypothetical protein GPECTOR_56g343 [Gonium pectorale]|uniref:Uncharacterized protein n=1 Tax=Gonium pectorale TaxID=33097 RepID=A0A150G5X4_GONPE|nr:hypothetical protein GPECTOR_56g343 [Gonium pectorale]|eukprot:KXZ45247.1 hypothetical protein GPECTOR_56g343 [Gonium pectorale]
MEPAGPSQYQSDADKCVVTANRGILRGREIRVICQILKDKPLKMWTRSDVEPLASALAGRVAVDGRSAEDRAGALLLDDLSENQEEFAKSNACPLPQLSSVGNSGLLWRFGHDEAGKAAALHWIGTLQALHPGLVCTVFRCSTPCTRY